jgi:competence protein ComEA
MIKKLLVLAALFSANVLATPVNINTADAKTIADSLSGIGLKKAQTIVDYRTKNGNFTSVDDLSKVSGIGEKTISKNKADILLNDAPTSSSSTDATKQPANITEESAVTNNNKSVEKKK